MRKESYFNLYLINIMPKSYSNNSTNGNFAGQKWNILQHFALVTFLCTDDKFKVPLTHVLVQTVEEFMKRKENRDGKN